MEITDRTAAIGTIILFGVVATFGFVMFILEIQKWIAISMSAVSLVPIIDSIRNLRRIKKNE